jgi:hypothetical protein
MPGPKPTHCPRFPAEFLARARQTSRRRSIPFALRQRARLACLLAEQPTLSHGQAAAAVQLHPDSVRLWRKRWAGGDFSLEDRPGRGRKATFSPPG